MALEILRAKSTRRTGSLEMRMADVLCDIANENLYLQTKINKRQFDNMTLDIAKNISYLLEEYRFYKDEQERIEMENALASPQS